MNQAAEDARYRELYQQATEQASRLMPLGGFPSPVLAGSPPAALAATAQKAIGLFEKCLELNPYSWPCMWFLGTMNRYINEDEIALDWFEKALRLEQSNADVWREASFEAGILGDAPKALYYARRAIDLSTEDHSLHANLAMALLMSKEDDQWASTEAQLACFMAPDDPINRRIKSLVDAVVLQGAPRPRRLPRYGESWSESLKSSANIPETLPEPFAVRQSPAPAAEVEKVPDATREEGVPRPVVRPARVRKVPPPIIWPFFGAVGGLAAVVVVAAVFGPDVGRLLSIPAGFIGFFGTVGILYFVAFGEWPG